MYSHIVIVVGSSNKRARVLVVCIRSHFGGRDDADVQAFARGTSACHYLEDFRIVGIAGDTDSDIIFFASHRTQCLRDEIVVAIVVPVCPELGHFIVGTVFPGRSVLVVVDDQHIVECFLVGEIDNIRHILRHGHSDTHDVALAALSGSIGCNHLITVGGLCLHLVGITLLRAGCYPFKAFYYFTIAKDADGEVLGQIIASDCCRWGGKRNDVLEFVGHLGGSQVADSLRRFSIYRSAGEMAWTAI